MRTWITPEPPGPLFRALVDALESAALSTLVPAGSRERTGADHPDGAGHQILEIWKPQWFEEVIRMDPRAGIGLPLRIHLHVQENQTHLTYWTASETLAPYPAPALAAWARAIDHELCTILTAAVQGL